MALDNRGGPPDLDDALRQFKNRIIRFFGGTPSPQGNDGASTAVLIGGVVIGLWLLTGFYRIDEQERGVVLRFGAYVGESGPGLHWNLPYPFERVEKVNLTRDRSVKMAEDGTQSQMLTLDSNIVEVRFGVQYNISSARDFLFNNRTDAGESEDGADLVKQAAESAMRSIVSRSPLDDVLNKGRDAIRVEAERAIQDLLDRYQSGIRVQRVLLEAISVPAKVQKALDDVNRAAQDKKRLESEGEAYRNDVVPRARGTAQQLIAEAESYETRVTAHARGEAQRFSQIVAEYQKAPQVTRDRLYLEAMQQILSTSTKILADQKSGQLLYLPLDKLVGTVTSPAPTGTAPTASPAPTAAPVTDPRLVDARKLDRESR